MIYLDSGTNTAVVAGDEQTLNEEAARVVGFVADSTNEPRAISRLLYVERYIREKLKTMPLWRLNVSELKEMECEAWADTDGDYFKTIWRLCHGDSNGGA